MKQIEVNTHSDRIELETEMASSALQFLYNSSLSNIDKNDIFVFDKKENCWKYTELGQAIFDDIVDVMSGYIKVKEDEN